MSSEQAIEYLSKLAHEFAQTSIKPITEDLEDHEQEFMIIFVENLFNKVTPKLPSSFESIRDLLLGEDVTEEEKVRQAVAYFKRTARNLQKTTRALANRAILRFTDPEELAEELADAPDCEDKRTLLADMEKMSGQLISHIEDPVELEYIVDDMLKITAYTTVGSQLMELVNIAYEAVRELEGEGAALVAAAAAVDPALDPLAHLGHGGRRVQPQEI